MAMDRVCQEILENNKSVREIIEAATSDVLMDAPDVSDISNDGAITKASEPENSQDRTLHLFVRRLKKDQDRPVKRTKVDDPEQALDLFFDWVGQFRNDTVEVWSDNAQDVRKFYRYCKDHRDDLEPLFRGSRRVKNNGLSFPQFIREVGIKAKESPDKNKGTLYPFVVTAK